MSVWESLDALTHFVYRNNDHGEIMRRRHEWFERIEFYLVLWWIESGHKPNLKEAKLRLEGLQANGPSPYAFTFKAAFPPPE